ncbi:hypothetical protein BJ742DRAFT_742454 [Cladochytrium replicatum]|nr:hypothetical protein BJ742DRAFT_742454 [Cladochytrium replicatum]
MNWDNLTIGSLGDYVDLQNINQMVRKVQAVVYNYGEYELKVRDATNNEAWGASSTLMQEIASGTHHYQHFHEIMDNIYKRFQEKQHNWRQVYKALQLLEYLIKNGSEKVIDNARDHQYEIKAIRNFHFIDEKGKDQGINVRNRAKEIIDLLGDDAKIKEERRKAKENRQKYSGLSSDAFSGGGSGRYGGFGNSGNAGGGGGGGYHDDETSPKRTSEDGPAPRRSNESTRDESKVPKPKFNIVMSDSGTSNKPTHTAPASSFAGAQPNLLDLDGGDEWGDFTSAKPSGPTSVASAPPVSPPVANFASFGAFASAPPQPQLAAAPLFAANFSAPAAKTAAPGSGFTSPTTTATNGSNGGGFANFANFAQFPAASTPTSPPAYTPTQTAAPASGLGGLDLHGGFGGAPAASGTTGFSTPSSATLGSQPKSNDPFGSLVSLDPSALTSYGKKEAPTGPSLNSLNSTTIQNIGFNAQFTPSKPASPAFPLSGSVLQPQSSGFGVPAASTASKPAQQQSWGGNSDSLI